MARPDEVEAGADDEAVVDEELDGEEGRGVDEVGREEGLRRSGEGPVVRDVEEGRAEGDERGDDEPEGGIAEFKRDVIGEHGSAVQGEPGVERDGGGGEESGKDEADGAVAGCSAVMGDGEKGRESRDRAEDGKVREAEHAQSGRHGGWLGKLEHDCWD